MVDEEPLPVGMNTESVVRIGDTVRRPVGYWTPAVHALLQHLQDEGFPAAPRVLGVDDEGREILTYVEGAPPGREDLTGDDRLHAAAYLVGELHRVSSRFVPPPGARWRPPAFDPGGGSLILHGDLGLWNVLVDGDHITFVDWDDACPGRPEWEAGYCLLSFANLFGDNNLADGEAAHRIRCFADGYGLTSAQLALTLDLVPQRCRWMSKGIAALADLGHPPAIRMRDAGTHLAWAGTADAWDARLPSWRRVLSV